mmetsp:Transcript_32269/g.93580  ORF Transcript_32269/g.93580 Transcript_32269/m.93580 type:complete len:94 (-) Transcript_32269:513-794(-)
MFYVYVLGSRSAFDVTMAMAMLASVLLAAGPGCCFCLLLLLASSFACVAGVVMAVRIYMLLCCHEQAQRWIPRVLGSTYGEASPRKTSRSNSR